MHVLFLAALTVLTSSLRRLDWRQRRASLQEQGTSPGVHVDDSPYLHLHLDDPSQGHGIKPATQLGLRWFFH